MAITVALAGYAAAPAQAFEFGESDGLHGTVNTTLSYGVDVRVADPSDQIVAKSYYNPLVGLLPNAQQRAAKGAFSANVDDGDLNYASGSAFSNAVKATSELKINHGDQFRCVRSCQLFLRFRQRQQRQVDGPGEGSGRSSLPYP